MNQQTNEEEVTYYTARSGRPRLSFQVRQPITKSFFVHGTGAHDTLQIKDEYSCSVNVNYCVLSHKAVNKIVFRHSTAPIYIVPLDMKGCICHL